MATQNTACDEGSGQWLPLTEYSVRSGVSLSTIRRKIKSNSIPYRLENGRYLILFQEKIRKDNMHNIPSFATPSSPGTVRRPSPQTPAPKAYVNPETLPIVERSVSMVTEAFEYALREKDARIQMLERQNAEMLERLEELRLLVQVLEEKFAVRY